MKVQVDRTQCLARARATNSARGAKVWEGRFWRNLAKKDVAKCFAEDSDPPHFGYRLKPTKWSCDGGLSVSAGACTCHHCAIALHPNASQYKHVVEIDLEALSALVGQTLCAEYDPEVETGRENPCHWVILSTEGSPDDLLMLLKSLFDDFSAFPQDEVAKSLVKEKKLKLEAALLVFRDVVEDSCTGEGCAAHPPAGLETR